MNKMKLQFEADVFGNVLFGEMEEDRITARIPVPEGASDDYGYLGMKRAIERHLPNDLPFEVVFPYDGQEEFLAEDADADEDVAFEIEIGDFYLSM